MVVTNFAHAQSDTKSIIGTQLSQTNKVITYNGQSYLGSFKRMKDLTVTYISLKPYKEGKTRKILKRDFNKLKEKLEKTYDINLNKSSLSNHDVGVYSDKSEDIIIQIILHDYKKYVAYPSCNVEVVFFSEELEEKRIKEIEMLANMSSKERKKYLREIKKRTKL
jgi:hypothetical protein